MLLPNGSMIKNDIIEAFNAAIVHPENITNGGVINWDFVAVDLSVDLGGIYSEDYLNECVEVLVGNYFAAK